jgi:two-component system, NarL family, invasion response regulator UvrY
MAEWSKAAVLKTVEGLPPPRVRIPVSPPDFSSKNFASAIKVVIVDDHDLVRLGVRRILESAPDIKVVGEANSGESAINLIKVMMPDVVFMDLRMPGIGGLEATRKLLRINPRLKIIVVTVCDEEPFPGRLVRAGAMGYITKNTSSDELLKAVRKVMSGHVYITLEVAQKMALRQVSNAARSPFSQLSERELQVMWMVTRGQEVRDIAKKLCLSPKTINTYRYRLFEKLGVSNNVELTHLAARYGMLEEESQPGTITEDNSTPNQDEST